MTGRIFSTISTTPLNGRPPGFTLLELLIVVVILGLLTTVITPSLTNHVRGSELRNITQILAMDLAQTRSRAITRQTEETLVLDVDRHYYRSTSKEHNRPLPKDIELILDSIRSEMRSDTSATIRFFPDGSSTGGRITLRRGQQQRSIDVAWLTGKVTVHD